MTVVHSNTYPLPDPSPYETDSVIADLNGDGKRDLIAGGCIALNNGNGTFAHLSCYASFGKTADLNGDGRLDFLEVDSYGPRMRVSMNERLP